MAKKLTKADIEQIRKLKRSGMLVHELAEMFNVSEHDIDRILCRL